jgi:hypothetical protein
MPEDLLFYVFVVLFVAGTLTLLRVKQLLNRHYPELHDKVFGRSLWEYSLRQSVKIVFFSIRETEWKTVSDPLVLRWLHTYRIVSLLFYLVIIVAIVDFFVRATSAI